MSMKIRKIPTSEVYLDTRETLELARSGTRLLITRYRSPELAIVPALDLRILRDLSRIAPETLTECFSHADQRERVSLVRIIAWIEELDEED